VKDLDETWNQLFTSLDDAARIDDPSNLEPTKINGLLASLNLVQPFEWRAWKTPIPALDAIPSLSMNDCVKQITRLVRANRTEEGLLWSSIKSGHLPALCRAARNCAAGQSIGLLPRPGEAD